MVGIVVFLKRCHRVVYVKVGESIGSAISHWRKVAGIINGNIYALFIFSFISFWSHTWWGGNVYCQFITVTFNRYKIGEYCSLYEVTCSSEGPNFDRDHDNLSLTLSQVTDQRIYSKKPNLAFIILYYFICIHARKLPTDREVPSLTYISRFCIVWRHCDYDAALISIRAFISQKSTPHFVLVLHTPAYDFHTMYFVYGSMNMVSILDVVREW